MSCVKCISLFNATVNKNNIYKYVADYLLKQTSVLSQTHSFNFRTEVRPLSTFNQFSEGFHINKPNNTIFPKHYHQLQKCVSHNTLFHDQSKYVNNRILKVKRVNQLGAFYSEEKDRPSKEYKENIYTIPNLLTLSRIACTPLLGYMIASESFGWALGLFVAAGITDLLDGFIARRYASQRTAFGTHLDPLADKLLVNVVAICLTSVDLFPVWLTGVIILRDVLLIIAVFYLRYKTLPPPKTFSRYWNINKASATLNPSTLSKLNTALQIAAISLSMAAPVFEFTNHPLLQTLWYLTAVTTFATGVEYGRDPWSFVKILNKKK